MLPPLAGLRVLDANLDEPLTFAEDAAFDLVVSQLVLHDLKDWAGVLVISTGHPFGDWLFAQRYLGPHSYFETRQFDATWGGLCP